MKKTIVISATSLILFAISMFIAINDVRDKVFEQTNTTTQIFNERVSISLDGIMLNAQRVAYSILSGYFFSESDSCTSSARHLTHSRFYISETDRKILTEKDLYKTLTDFMRVNSFCYSAVFFLNDDAFPNMPRKYRAPMVYRVFEKGDPRTLSDYEKQKLNQFDLRDSVPFENRKHYKEALEPGYKTVWKKTSLSKKKDGFLVSLYIPIRREDHKILGVFCVSIPLLNYANYAISTGLPFKGSYMDIFDESGDQILTTIDSIDTKTEYLTYHSKVMTNGWKVVTHIPKKEAYAAVTYVQYVLWIMSIVAIIFVSIAAASISRALRKNIKQRAALASELQLASKTQQDILKPTTFNAENFKLNATLIPAKDVGGDLYDYYILKGRNEDEHDLLYFIIGDVSGKGMPAALMMTQVCSLFRDIVRFRHTPEEILSRINDILAERNDLMMFCTAFIGTIDLKTLEMNYANAGHDKPVIIRSNANGETDSSSAFFQSIKPNVPMAIREGRTFKGDTIQLQKGNQVVLYTDGITESMNKNKVQFGEANLLKTLQQGEDLLDAVKKHAAGADQSDDITILSISL